MGQISIAGQKKGSGLYLPRYLVPREDLTPGRVAAAAPARARQPDRFFDQGMGPLPRGSGDGGGGGSSIVYAPNSRFQMRSRAVS
jgi:hypothetical protein